MIGFFLDLIAISLHEHPEKNKLNHISWNKMEPAQFVSAQIQFGIGDKCTCFRSKEAALLTFNYFQVIVADSSNEVNAKRSVISSKLKLLQLVICDVRMPCRPLMKYNKHLRPVNSVDWAPHSATHFCSGSSDHQALIWQLQSGNDEPLLAYRSEGEITRIRWNSAYSNWIGVSFGNCVEILRV